MRLRSLFLSLAVVFFLIIVACVSAGVMAASRADLARFELFDKQDGRFFSVPVPIAIFRTAARIGMTKHVHSRSHDRDLADLRLALQAVSKSLEDSPDFTILEVNDDSDHVTMRREGLNVVIHITSRDSEINISVPHRSLRDLAEQIPRGSSL